MSGGIFVTRAIPEAGLDRVREAGIEVAVWPGPQDGSPSRREILHGAREARVLLSLLTETVDAELLAALPRLLGISNYAVGYDNVDVGAATLSGVPVGNTPGVLTESTADLTWALLLAAARNVVSGDAYMRGGGYRRWGPQLLLGHDVSPGCDGRRRVLGIVGLGRIGKAVARRAVGFDMQVIASGERQRIEASGLATWTPFEDLLRRADFVSLHLPLNEATHHLIGAAQLAMMKPTAYLVNTSRGAVVDEAALVEALRNGRIAGAALDVYEHEPSMAAGLAELGTAVLLPHLGSATRATRDRMAVMAADNAIAMWRGEPAPHCVNPEVYDGPPYRRRRLAWP